MKLNNPLTSRIKYKDSVYVIDLSYNKVLDVLEILSRKDILTTFKLGLIIRLLIGDNNLSFVEQSELWEYIRDTHINISNKRHLVYDLQGNLMPTIEENSKQIIDLEADARYIYASFRQIGINLFEEQGRMKWEEFQVLLESLPDDTIIQKIIQIRLWKPQKGDSSKYKESMRKAQVKYKLPAKDGEDYE